MNYINTDKQTYADLNIVEGEEDRLNLLSLFSATETKNGRLLMQNWLMYPLSDFDTIRVRQEAIDYDALPELPMTEEEIDFIEYYLNYRDQLRIVHPLMSVATYIDRLFKYDSYRYVIKRGVTLLIQMLYQLDKMQKGLPENAPALLQEFARAIREAVSETGLKSVLEQLSDKEVKLSFYGFDKYDFLFRSTSFHMIKNLMSFIYQLDVCRTAHRIARKKNLCCCPQLVHTMDFEIYGFVHPFVKKGVTNDWKMSTGNICLVTGSNMAGKSTSLKALTLAVWLAHCGLPISANYMVCPLYDCIYTSINLPDSLRDGRSHFMAEILRIKEVLQKAADGQRCLIVLDEMFRGTNAQDAFDASKAVNELLKEYKNSHFLISTHILEFAKTFEDDSACCFYYMNSELREDELFCSYRLLKGISETRVGYWMVKKHINIPMIQSANAALLQE